MSSLTTHSMNPLTVHDSNANSILSQVTPHILASSLVTVSVNARLSSLVSVSQRVKQLILNQFVERLKLPFDWDWSL